MIEDFESWQTKLLNYLQIDISNELKNLVDLKLSLSSMTFTHEQALYLLIEQLYRVQCFEKNISYSK